MSNRGTSATQFRSLAGLRATLIGLGRRTNVSLARYLVGQGVRVRISERKDAADLTEEMSLLKDGSVDYRLGGHQESDIDDTDVIFVTPGAPRDLPVLGAARRRGIPISNEIELLFARCRAPMIGITGSAGKTTTTTLVGSMLRRGIRQVYVGGNIGTPLIELVDQIAPDARVVLELSSYQLESLGQSPGIGAILNVTPNHLDRHGTFENYRESKLNLLRHQLPDDIAVLGADDPVAASLSARCLGSVRWFSSTKSVEIGAFCRGNDLVIRDDSGEATIATIADLRVPGGHNVLNVLAAATIARAVDIDPKDIGEVARQFGGVAHRLEHVRRIGSIDYVNDSIATSPERSVAALRSFSRPVVLIAGGRTKHLPTDDLAAEIGRHCRAVVAIGEMSDEIAQAVETPSNRGPILERATSIGDAVKRASRLARPGDVVLLSPAGTSFDQFRDFEDRGQQFKIAVANLTDGA